MELDPWQKEVLEYDGHILLCTGRQVGKTTIFARKAGDYLLSHAGSRIIVVSLTEDQAQLMIIMVLSYLEKVDKKRIAKGNKKPTKNKIELTNGSQILARPVGNTGDAVRGFTGDVLIVDEASKMPEDMWMAAKPTLLTTGGQIWMCSTPHGKQGYFYECYLNKHNRFKVVHVNSVDVIAERAISDVWTEHRKREAMEFLEQERKDMTALEFGQEFLGQFLDDLRQLFPDDLVAERCIRKRENAPTHGSFYLGVDIARMGGDETTFEIVDFRNKSHLEHVESIVQKNTRLTETIDVILALNKKYAFKKIYIDDGGLGAGVYDFLLEQPEVKNKVVAINNASRPLEAAKWDETEPRKKRILKEDLYSNLLRLLERAELFLLDDMEIRLSLKSVQYEIDADTKKVRIFGDYTHIAEGLVRAAWCVKDKTLNLSVVW